MKKPLDFPRSFTIISDEVSQDLRSVVRFVREFGFGGFELRSLFGRAFRDLSRRDVARIRAVVRGEGWRVYGCASPVFKCPRGDRAAIREHGEVFKRALDVARALDCDLIRVFTFLRESRPAGPAELRQVGEALRGLGEAAKGSGVRIGVENEYSCLVGTGDEAAGLLPELPARGFGIVWDPCNLLYLPGAEPDPGRDLSRLAPRIVHVHVKDAVRRPRKRGGPAADPAPVGLGEVGWRSYLGLIRRSGYRGMLSLETHWRVTPVDSRLLHLPAGRAFSLGGEEASRTCLHNLRALWERAS